MDVAIDIRNNWRHHLMEGVMPIAVDGDGGAGAFGEMIAYPATAAQAWYRLRYVPAQFLMVDITMR